MLFFVLIQKLMLQNTLKRNTRNLKGGFIKVHDLDLHHIFKRGLILVMIAAGIISPLQKTQTTLSNCISNCRFNYWCCKHFKSVGVNKRLSIFIEGESLFNDGLNYSI